jgi:hypothetical protein
LLRGPGTGTQLLQVYAFEDFGLDLLAVMETCASELGVSGRVPGLDNYDYIAGMLGHGICGFGPESLHLTNYIHGLVDCELFRDEIDCDPRAARWYEQQFSVDKSAAAARALARFAFRRCAKVKTAAMDVPPPPTEYQRTSPEGAVYYENTYMSLEDAYQVAEVNLFVVSQCSAQCIAIWQRCLALSVSGGRGRGEQLEQQVEEEERGLRVFFATLLSQAALLPLGLSCKGGIALCAAQLLEIGGGGTNAIDGSSSSSSSSSSGSSCCTAPPLCQLLSSFFSRLPADNHVLQSIMLFCFDPCNQYCPNNNNGIVKGALASL